MKRKLNKQKLQNIPIQKKLAMLSFLGSDVNATLLDIPKFDPSDVPVMKKDGTQEYDAKAVREDIPDKDSFDKANVTMPAGNRNNSQAAKADIPQKDSFDTPVKGHKNSPERDDNVEDDLPANDGYDSVIIDGYEGLFSDSDDSRRQNRRRSGKKPSRFDEEYMRKVDHSSRELEMDNFVKRAGRRYQDPKINRNTPPMEVIRYLEDCGIHFFLIDGNPAFYNNDTGEHRPLEIEGNKELLLRQLSTHFVQSCSPQIIFEALKYIKLMEGIPRISAFNKPYNLWNFKDGVYDIMEDKVYPHSPRFGFTYYIDAYTDEIDFNWKSCDILRETLYNSFRGDKESVIMFMEFGGVALGPIRDRKLILILKGPHDSGKSVGVNTISGLIPQEFRSSLSILQLTKEHDCAQLYGKTLNISGEMPRCNAQRSDLIKSLSGNDEISASFKFKDVFSFRNNALMIFAANNLPVLTDADEALYSRYRILEYKYTVPPEKRIPHLEQKLLKEKGALLGFFIEGARRFINNGCQFTYRSESEKKLLQQLRSKDSFASFADEMLVADPYAELTSAEIISAYTDYCRDHGYKPLSNNVWSRQLIGMFDAEHKAIGHSGSKGYKGVRFR